MHGVSSFALDKRRRLRSSGTLASFPKTSASICAAPKVLASAGLLDGRQATGYPGVLDRLNLPRTEVLQRAVVTDGHVVTSRGPGTALDFALELVEHLLGRPKRDEVEAALVRG